MEDLNFNIFNIIIISGVVYGIIFCSIILTQKRYITNNTLYLGLTVLFLSLSNFQYWLLDTSLVNYYSFLKYIYIPWHWLVLPMFYSYVYKFIGHKKINSKRKLLLFSPFFFVLIIHITQILYKFFINNQYEIPSHFKRGIFVYLEFFSFIFNVLVMFFTFKLITAYEKDETYDYKWVKSETNWLKKLIYTGVIVCFCWLMALIFVVIFNIDKSYLFYPMWIGISFLVYWIGHLGINKSIQLKKRIDLRKKRIQELNYNNIIISENKNHKSFNKIKSAIINKKLYLNPKLSLQQLSEILNLSEGYISQVFNSNSDSNFNDFINQLRIEESKQMLASSDFKNYTIESIGLECGFNSKSSFYTAFKKFTGKTPVQYKKDVRNL